MAFNGRSRYLLGWIGGDEILVFKHTGKLQLSPVNAAFEQGKHRTAVVIPGTGDALIWIEYRTANDAGMSLDDLKITGSGSAFETSWNAGVDSDGYTVYQKQQVEEQFPGVFVRQHQLLIDASRRTCAAMGEAAWAQTEMSNTLLGAGTILEISNGIGVGDVRVIKDDDGTGASVAEVSVSVESSAECMGFYPDLGVGLYGVWSYCGVFKDGTSDSNVHGFCDGQRSGDRWSESQIKSGDKNIWQYITEKLEAAPQPVAQTATTHFFTAYRAENRDGAACANSVIQVEVPAAELPTGWKFAAYHGENTEPSNSRELVFGLSVPESAPAKDYDLCVVVQNARSGLQSAERLRLSLPMGLDTEWYVNNRPSEYQNWQGHDCEKLYTKCNTNIVPSVSEHHLSPDKQASSKNEVWHPDIDSCVEPPNQVCTVGKECPVSKVASEAAGWGTCHSAQADITTAAYASATARFEGYQTVGNQQHCSMKFKSWVFDSHQVGYLCVRKGTGSDAEGADSGTCDPTSNADQSACLVQVTTCKGSNEESKCTPESPTDEPTITLRKCEEPCQCAAGSSFSENDQLNEQILHLAH